MQEHEKSRRSPFVLKSARRHVCWQRRKQMTRPWCRRHPWPWRLKTVRTPTARRWQTAPSSPYAPREVDAQIARPTPSRPLQHDVVFDYPHFVRELLMAAHAIGREALERVTSSLHAATVSGVRSTTPGEPFPEDVRLEKHASEVLNSLSRWDPSFGL